jgi:hypothetical protein
MLNFVLWLLFFFCLHTDKNIAVLSQLVFFALILTSIWQFWKKNNNQRTKLSIYILDTIESESTTRFNNRSSDHMMTSDSFIPAGFFCPHTDKHLAILSKRTFDTQSIHIFGLVYYLSTSRNSPFYKSKDMNKIVS